MGGVGATAIAVAALLAAVLGLALQIVLLAGRPPSAFPWALVQNGSFTLAATVLGGVLARQPAARAVGGVLLVSGVAGALGILLSALGDLAIVRGSDAATALHLGAEALWPFFAGTPLIVLPLVFPSGLLRGWAWRTAAALAGLVLLSLVLATLTLPVIDAGYTSPALPNPLAQPGLSSTLMTVAAPLGVLCALVGLLSLVIRFVRGSRLVRQQLALPSVAVVLLLAALLLHGALPAPVFQLSAVVGPLLVLGSIALAVLRYELYDMDLVVSRVALYSAMTAGLTAVFVVIYTAALALAVRLPFAPDPWLAGASGAAVAVLCAEPVRRRLQGWLERRVLGERSRPLVALARLSASVRVHEESSVVDAMAVTIAEAVRSPGVAVVVFTAGMRDGEPIDGDPLVIPLVHRQEHLGELRIQRRSRGEDYPIRDQELLRQLADHAATILHGLRRDEELGDARRQAITRAAEERARLGRDLHDGVGPLLAGAGLTAEALRRGLPEGSADERDAARLAERLRLAAGEIRRLAHDLQPAPLAEGLAPALAEHLRSLDGPRSPAMTLSVDAEDVPDAVQQTAWLLVLEATSNIVRHAHATRASVAVSREAQALSVVVEDDGVGMGAAYLSGMGVTSMRRRVQALGGSFSIAERPGGGTAVTARIPLEA